LACFATSRYQEPHSLRSLIPPSPRGWTRDILYIGISNDTTAHAMAIGMLHAGASDVAQLGVNWSYPKILLFPLGPDGRRQATSLFKGFVFRDDEYVERASTRDVSYLVRRAATAGTHSDRSR
jgi:hypothetical protein